MTARQVRLMWAQLPSFCALASAQEMDVMVSERAALFNLARVATGARSLARPQSIGSHRRSPAPHSPLVSSPMNARGARALTSNSRWASTPFSSTPTRVLMNEMGAASHRRTCVRPPASARAHANANRAFILGAHSPQIADSSI